jgi:hypothetical protein
MKQQKQWLTACAVCTASAFGSGAAMAQSQTDHDHAHQHSALTGVDGQCCPEDRQEFDTLSNPAMGLVLDGYGMIASGEGSAPGYDNIGLRKTELSLAGRIDDLAWAYVSFGAVPHDGDYEFELAEAVIWADQLPYQMSARAGRFLADVGKWNTFHQHDRPHPFSQGVQQEFLSGALAMDGVELHQQGQIAGAPVRWSIGVGSRFEGHGHPLLTPEGDGEHNHGLATTELDGLGLGAFAWTGRITGRQNVGDHGFFQWGASAFLTPSGLSEEHDDGGTIERFELGQSTFVLDFTYRHESHDGHSSDTGGVEFYWNRRDIHDEIADVVRERDAVGLWGFYQHGFTERWAAGAEGSWWEHADKANGGSWLSGEAGRQAAVFASWSPSHQHRLRLAVGINQPDPSVDLDTLVALQWQVIFGAHIHSLNW